jgi:disulfide bond formation protein DsbB
VERSIADPGEVLVDGLLVASRFFGLLTIATNLLVIGLAAIWLGSRWSRMLAGARATVLAQTPRSLLGLAWSVATVATLGSLYYSDVVGFPPCLLCWYQRIAMYPLAVVLGVAALRADRGSAWYTVPVAALGAAIALYHYFLEWFPTLDVGACSVDVPCSVPWFRTFGFISLPYMALSGFLAVVALSLIAYRTSPSTSTEEL